MGGLKEGRRTWRTWSYPRGIRSKLRSAAEVVRYLGAWEFAIRVLPWSFSRDYFIFSQDLDRIVPYPPPSVPCRVRPARMEDIPALMDLRKGYYSRALLEKRMKEGHMAFLGRSGDKPVYSHWMLVGSLDIPYLHGRLVLRPGEVYADEAFVHPEFQRFGIYAHGAFLAKTAIRAKGFRRMYCAVASWNKVPREIMIRSGMTEIARLRCRNVPGLVKVRWSGRVDVHDDGSFAFHGAR
jgi:hypothetical protein